MPKEYDNITEYFGEPISVNTSVQTEDDGILIQIGNAIINYMTRSVYEKCIKSFAISGMWEQFAESQVAYENELTK